MSTLQVEKVRNFAGTGDPDIAGAAKMRVSINPNGTFDPTSLNVASVTKLGGGAFLVTLTNPAPSASWQTATGVTYVTGTIPVATITSMTNNTVRLGLFNAANGAVLDTYVSIVGYW